MIFESGSVKLRCALGFGFGGSSSGVGLSELAALPLGLGVAGALAFCLLGLKRRLRLADPRQAAQAVGELVG